MAFVKQNNSWKNQSLMENLQEYLNKQLDAFVENQEQRKKKTRTTNDQKKRETKPPSRSNKSFLVALDNYRITPKTKTKPQDRHSEKTVQDIFRKYRKKDVKPNPDESVSAEKASGEDRIKEICQRYRTGRKKYSEKLKEEVVTKSKDGGRARSESLSDRFSKGYNSLKCESDRKLRSKSEDLSEKYRLSCSYLDTTSEILKSVGKQISPSKRRKDAISSSPKFNSLRVGTKGKDTKMRASFPAGDMDNVDNPSFTSYLSVGEIGKTKSHESLSEDKECALSINQENSTKEGWNVNSDDLRRKQLEKFIKENGRRYLELDSMNKSGNNKHNDVSDTRNDVNQKKESLSRDTSHDTSAQNSDFQNRNSCESTKENLTKDVCHQKDLFFEDDELTKNIQADLEKWRGRRRERMKERPCYQRSVSEGARDSRVQRQRDESSSNVTDDVEHDINSITKEYYSEEEIDKDMRNLQEKLRQCTDFGERRKIRGIIRKLREKKSTLEISATNSGCQNHPVNSGEVSPVVTEFPKDFTQIDDIPQLRRLLSETSDYDEKKKIRLALRQLRQRDKERENGRDGGKINGRGLGRSHSFASQHTSSEKNGEIVHESGDRPKVIRSSSVLEAKSRSSTTENSAEPKSCETGSDVVLSRRDFLSDETKKVTTANVYSKENVSSGNHLVDRISELNSKSKDIVHDRKPPLVPNGFYQYSSEKTNLETPTSSLRHSVKDSHSHLQPLSFSSSRLARKSSNPDASELCQNKSSRSPLPNSPSADTPRRSRSVVEANIGQIPKVNNEKEFKAGTDIESQAKKWLEGKKRSCSLPGGDNNNLSSTSDMEAAFSELLSAVDDRVDNLSDTEVAEMDLIEEDTEEKMRRSSTASLNDDDNKDDSKYDATVDKTSPSSTSVDMDVRKTNSDDEDKTKKFSRGEISISPEKSIKRPHFDSDLSPTPKEDKSAISVIEDDDGSVTVQSTTRSDLGDHTITEKLRLRRTESRTEEEEKDTIIESKITSPGGSDHYSKDVIKTRRKVTSRGSDYFTKSAYNIKKRRDFEGDEIEEQDLSVETDNFSATKGESWGDRAEAKVQVVRTANSFPTSIPEDQAVRSDTLPELAGTLTNGSSHGRMDVSKTSSGYGSVSGSDEEEKEDVTSSRRGRQAGCPEIKSPLKDVISQEGSTAVLECTVSCSPLPTVTWYKGNKPVEASRHFEPKFDSLTGKACLTVLNAGSENGGEYRCVFKNPLGQAETKSRLTVRSRALKKPVFTSPLKDMTVTEGQAVVFECKVTDATQISWYKDGIIQRNSSDFKQTFDGCFAKLEIGEIFLDDTGEYSCIAKNEKGEAKTVCKIKVKEDSGDGDVVPMFLTKPESRIYSGGDIIILECDVIGTPQPVVTWFRDGTKLSNTSKHRSLYDGRVATLKISQTVQEDSGKYEVTAKNTTGEVKVDCLIVVKAKQGPPSIMYSLSDSTATVGKPLILHCDIRGSPVPMILWRKNGRMIGNTADFKQTYENNMAKLEIKDVYEQDGGCYECVARNSFGSVSTSCNITVEGKKPSGKTTTKKTDWLVGRDNNTPEEQMAKSSNIDKLKSAGVRRSESVKVTSNYSIRDKYSRKADVKVENDGATSTHAQKSDTNNTSSTSVSSLIDRKNTESNKKSENVTEKSTGKEDPPWKNVTLRRTESAKMSNYSRSKPLSWKRDGKNENKDSDENENQQNESENRSSTPVGWRPVSMEFKEDLPKPETEIDRLKAKSGLRRSESARAVGSNIDVVSKFIFDAQRKEKDSNVKKSEPASFEKSKSVREIDRLKDEEGIGFRHSKSKVDSNVEENNNDKKLGRSQSMRLLFESKAEPLQNVKEEPKTTTPSYLAKRNIGVRRTSSLKVTEKEAESFRSRQHENGVQLNLAPVGKEAEDSVSSRRRAWENGPNTSDMSSYDTIEDEEELHKILSKTENFEERKKIRARMKEIREKKQQDWEQKRLQREKETEDVVKRKFQLAEQEKQRKMKEFDKMAVEASKERERINAKKEELLQDKIRQADLDKKRHLETFDKLARHDDVKKTVQKTPGGGTRTIIIKDSQASPVFGGITYGKSTTEQAANFLTNQLIGAVSPGTAGKITVKTESWSSKDGVTNRSEKTESWGAKPQGPQGAKSMFQQMDASAPKPNVGPAGRGGGGGGRALMRSPSAIKQMLLEWTKAMTKEYQEYGVEVTNFSSSWNNGMAFCALIHHFYPDSFDFSKLDPKQRRKNFTLAFDTAENVADIAPLLDVDDMVKMQKPDWKCVFTYVQSFYRKLHTHERNATASKLES